MLRTLRRFVPLLIGIVAILLVMVPWAREEPRAAAAGQREVALFAGGCFWCMEEAFEPLPGVVSVTSGFAGGHVPEPTYARVTRGGTGHLEVVEVVFDPRVTSYERLLEHFWRNIDPENPHGQFCDIGPQYRSAIFAMDDRQRRAAEASRRQLVESREWRHFATPVLPAARFYPAETYHQDYYRKNPLRYRYYKTSCGRVARLEHLWGRK